MPLSGHDDVALLNYVTNDAESTQKKHVIIAGLKSETIGQLIDRIPGSHLLISSLPGSALRMHVESLGKPLVNLISKYTHLVFSKVEPVDNCPPPLQTHTLFRFKARFLISTKAKIVTYSWDSAS